MISFIPEPDKKNGVASKKCQMLRYDPFFSCVVEIHGNGRSDLEDLALPSRSSRESDEVGRRVCIELVNEKGYSEVEKLNSVEE